MKSIVSWLSRLVQRAPLAVVVLVLALTAVLGWLTTSLETAQGQEGFAPENAEITAAETISEELGSTGETVVQVLVTDEDAGLLGRDGLEATAAIEDALRADPEVGPRLAEDEARPAVLSWMLPAAQAAQAGALPPDPDDQTVAGAYQAALAESGPAERDLVASLLPAGVDPEDAPEADAGLVVVFLDTGELPEGSERFEDLVALEQAVVDAVADAELPGGVSADAFAFELLFAEDDAFQSEIARLFSMAFVIILVILAFVYWVRPSGGIGVLRSARRTAADVVLTLLTIVLAITWMNGVAALLGPEWLGAIGPMTEVTQVLPVLLIGLGVDYAIHLTARYREELAGQRPVGEAIGGAVRTVGIALALATLTTAVGFLTNVANPVPALRDFGVVAAVGITASFVLMLTFVPAVRLLADRRAERAGRLPAAALASTGERLLPSLMVRTAWLARRAPIVTLLVTVLLGGALGAWGMSTLETRFSFTDFVPDDNPIVATYETIDERFDGGFGERTQVLLRGDLATPERHNALVTAAEDLGDVPDVVTLEERAQATSILSVLAGHLGAGPAQGPADPDVAAAAAQAGVGGDLRVDEGADVEGLYRTLAEASPEEVSAVYQGDLALVEVQTRAGEEGAGDLADGIADAFAPLAAEGVDAVPTSDAIINDAVVSALSASQVSSLAITLAAATLLLVVTFWIEARRPMLGILTTTPVALVVLWTFGAMAAADIPFGPVTATIAALAIGIGVPYTIHVTNRFREDRAKLDLDAAITSTVRNTGGALAGSAFTTVAGFGVLVTSSLTPFRQFGLVTAFAIGFALCAATLVLPSMLTLWDRWHVHRGRTSAVAGRAAPPRGWSSDALRTRSGV